MDFGLDFQADGAAHHQARSQATARGERRCDAINMRMIDNTKSQWGQVMRKEDRR